MNRTGFEKKLNTVIAFLKKKKEHVFSKGLCTHAGAESPTIIELISKDSKIFINIYVMN
jgi:alanine racemase